MVEGAACAILDPCALGHALHDAFKQRHQLRRNAVIVAEQNAGAGRMGTDDEEAGRIAPKRQDAAGVLEEDN